MMWVSAWEEINDATCGWAKFWLANYGRQIYSGVVSNFYKPGLCLSASRHGVHVSDGIGCAIVGGAFISPSNTNYPASIGVNISSRIIAAIGSICWIFRPVRLSVLRSQRR